MRAISRSQQGVRLFEDAIELQPRAHRVHGIKLVCPRRGSAFLATYLAAEAVLGYSPRTDGWHSRGKSAD
jgi:hypothetical protein